jgi:cysteine-rich repeat protein
VNNRKITVAMAMLALVFGACNNTGATPGNNGPKAGGSVGDVEFNLDLEDAMGNPVDTVDTIALNLVCPGINQDHVLDVTDGAVTAEFGGLEPGMCTVTLEATTNDNAYDCAGSEAFTIVADQVISVGVTLVCIGQNDGNGGGVNVGVDFEINDCADDRIQKIWAIPSNVLTGASTTVNAELVNLVGTPSISWATENAMGYVAMASTQPGGVCDADAQSCQAVRCDGLGGSTVIDPVTNLPTAAVWVTVTVEDDECRDSERVSIDCLQGSVCGDSVLEGAEQCDDGNTVSGDGCQADCTLPAACGNGTLNAGEACDPGLSGTECIGCVDPAEQTCGSDCTIVPECGNNIVEAGEACDDGVAGSAACTSTCTAVGPAGDACLECLNDPTTVANQVLVAPNCNEASHPLCYDILACMAESRCKHLSVSGSAVECFCGVNSDINACLSSATFTDAGPCVDEIRAAVGASVPRTEVVANMLVCTAPGQYGCAGFAIDLATDLPDAQCTTQCDAPPTP